MIPFKIGDRVKVTDPGVNYSHCENMSHRMRLTKYVIAFEGLRRFTTKYPDTLFTIVSILPRHSQPVYAIESQDTFKFQFIVDSRAIKRMGGCKHNRRQYEI